jgi:hypothetical protein
MTEDRPAEPEPTEAELLALARAAVANNPGKLHDARFLSRQLRIGSRRAEVLLAALRQEGIPLNPSPMNPPSPQRPHLFGLLAGLFLAAALCFASVILSSTWVRLMESQVIKVTGSARQNVRSDLVVWNSLLQSEGKTLQEAHAKFEADQAKLTAFLRAKGFSDFSFSPVSVRDIGKRKRGPLEDETEPVAERTGYQLVRAVQISSSEVEALPRLAADSLSLLADGVVVQTHSIEFIYTKAAETKVKLMAEATEDALRRAEEIAQRGGRRVRELRTARMGVVQVNPLHSSATSWEGNDNRDSLDKTITSTVSAEFSLR